MNKIYYFFQLPALFLHLLIFYVFDLSSLAMSLFLFGFSWSLFLLAPSIALRVRLKRYRFSLLRFCYLLHNSLKNFLQFQFPQLEKQEILIRLFLPLLMASLLFWLLGISLPPFYCLWGSGVSEGAYWLQKRYEKRKYS